MGLLWVRRLPELGRNQGGSSTRTKIQIPPAKRCPAGAAKAAEVALDTDSWCPRGALGPAAPLPSQAPSHHSSLGTPAAPPPAAPYSLAALSATAALTAQRPSLPAAGFLCLRRAVPPGVFPSLPSPGHPSPRCLPTPCRVEAREPRMLETPHKSPGRRVCWGGAGGHG